MTQSDISIYQPDFSFSLPEKQKDEIFAQPLCYMARELEKLAASDLTPAQYHSVENLSRLARKLCLATENMRFCQQISTAGKKDLEQLLLPRLLEKHLGRQKNIICDLDPGLPLAMRGDKFAWELLLRNLSFLAAAQRHKLLLRLWTAGYSKETIWLGLQLRLQKEARAALPGDQPAFSLAQAATGKLLYRLGGQDIELAWPEKISCLLPLQAQYFDLLADLAATDGLSALIVSRRPTFTFYLEKVLRCLQVRTFICASGAAGARLLDEQRQKEDRIGFCFCDWQLADVAALAEAIKEDRDRGQYALAIFCSASQAACLPLSWLELYLPLSRLKVFPGIKEAPWLIQEISLWLKNPVQQEKSPLINEQPLNEQLPTVSIDRGLLAPQADELDLPWLLQRCCREIPGLLEKAGRGDREERQEALRELQAAAACCGAAHLHRICRSYLAALEGELLAEKEERLNQQLRAEVGQFLISAAGQGVGRSETNVAAGAVRRKISEARWQQDLHRLIRLLLLHKPYESRRLIAKMLKFHLAARRRLGLELIMIRIIEYDFAAAAAVARCLAAAGSRTDISREALCAAAGGVKREGERL